MSSLGFFKFLRQACHRVLQILTLRLEFLLNVSVHLDISLWDIFHELEQSLVHRSAQEFRVHDILQNPINGIFVVTNCALVFANHSAVVFDKTVHQFLLCAQVVYEIAEVSVQSVVFFQLLIHFIGLSA